MYSLTEEGKKAFLNGITQAQITIIKNANTITLTNKDIVQGGLCFNNYCTNAESLTVGAAVAAEVSITLENSDGRWTHTDFMGANVSIVLIHDDYTVPMGEYIIDDVKKSHGTLIIGALDNMVLFDVPSNWDGTTTAPIQTIISSICTYVGVDCNTDLTTLPNSTLNVALNPAEERIAMTCREVIQYCAALTGTCAFIDRNGKLNFKWYTQTTVDFIKKEYRYSSVFDIEDITITGITVKNDRASVTVGTDDYVLTISDIPIIAVLREDQLTSVAQNIYNAIGGTTYRPFEASLLPMPWIDIMDAHIGYDEEDVQVVCLITDLTYTLNGVTAVRARGESKVKKSYGAISPLTEAQKTAIAAANANANEAVQTAESAASDSATALSTANSAQSTANSALAIANGKNRVYHQDTAPTGSFVTGDLWFDTANDNKIHRWSGSAWVAEQLGSEAIAELAAEKIIAGELIGFTIDNGNGTFHVDDDGNVTATSGYIGEFELKNGALTTGPLNANDISVGGVYLGPDGFRINLEAGGNVYTLLRAMVDSAFQLAVESLNARDIVMFGNSNAEPQIIMWNNAVTKMSSLTPTNLTVGSKANVQCQAMYGTCGTAAATAAKVVTCADYALCNGGIIAIYFTYSVPASATLNINGTGAKSIYWQNAPITAGVINAGNTCLFVYDGSYFRLLTIDSNILTTWIE